METIDYKNFLGITNINNGKNQIKARVISVDANNSKALVETVDGSMRIKLNNKTGELLSVGDYVVVEYDKMLTKKNAYISLRNGQANPVTKVNIENAIVIQEKVASYLLHEYTVVDYVAGNRIVYGGATNPIIVNGYKVNVNGNHTSNSYSEIQFSKMYTEVNGYDGGFYSDARLYFTIENINSDNIATVKFVLTNKNGGTIISTSRVTQNVSMTGVKLEYNSIYPPTTDFLYGYMTGYLYVEYISKSTNNKVWELFSKRSISVGFSSESEYNAAIGLTYEPVTLSQVNETVTEI